MHALKERENKEKTGEEEKKEMLHFAGICMAYSNCMEHIVAYKFQNGFGTLSLFQYRISALDHLSSHLGYIGVLYYISLSFAPLHANGYQIFLDSASCTSYQSL